MQVLVNGESPQTALAALMQPSQRPFEILIVVPAVSTFKDNFAVPLAPTVLVGLPSQCVIFPAMLPHMERRATCFMTVNRIANRITLWGGEMNQAYIDVMVNDARALSCAFCTSNGGRVDIAAARLRSANHNGVFATDDIDIAGCEV